MSDAPMGPGWWQGQDGKWYPPMAPMQPGPPPMQYRPMPASKKSGNKVVIGLLACGGLFLVVVVIAALTPSKTSTVAGPSTTGAASSPSLAGPTSSTEPLSADIVEQQFAEYIARACEAKKTDAALRAVVKPEWSGKTQADVDAAVGACLTQWQQQKDAERAAAAEAERQRKEAEVAGIIANAQSPSVDAIVKNPDAVKGQVYVMIVEITQYDASTGPCAFRAYWDNTVHEYGFEYKGDNGIFSSGDGEKDCPLLTGVDDDDVARVWVRSLGSIKYDTQIGGATTAPAFEVLKAEVLTKK